MYKMSLTIVLLLIGIIECFSQTNLDEHEDTTISDFTINFSSRKVIHNSKGSPYYNRNFMFGKIELINNTSIHGLLRYNIYFQEFELIIKRDTLVITDPTKIKSIDFAGKSFIYSLILEKNGKNSYISGAYFEKLNSGECKLLIKRDSNLKENRYAENYMGGFGDGSLQYIHKESYYLKLADDKPARKINFSKKQVHNLFPKNKIEIEKFISENNIHLNKIQDIVKVINYYNQLCSK